MTAGDALATNAKAVVSVIGGLINLVAVAVVLFRYAPATVAQSGAGLVTAMEMARSFNVWYVRNRPVIATAAHAGAELVAAIGQPETEQAGESGGA
ncbi:hypothetical protein C5E45_34265 [Nocardia nova]|uniref:Uncharacterized protein n=2 Tax=Nocardia TaxID=1817 RepID=A0A2T2YRE4_9NOCA|nr:MULTISPECIES: hypothetical protein [Nocardia]MBF6449036.1 hypothetical protein [Nocardia elegans]PPJ18819.1 hypothetical protein C5E41_32040 [Nocardia nova]PPJ29046.1 hypothetical protein C5E45_34265 [Nocardia nova]PSR58046.1 hypothetical protein C8259_32065 [Nocardia nova]